MSESFPRRSQLALKPTTDLIKPIVSSDSVLFDKKRRATAIREVASNSESKMRRIRRLLGHWWRRGQTVNSLAPAYGGNAGKSFAGKAIGRKSASGKRHFSLTQETRCDFDRIVRRYVFARKQSMSLLRAYSMYLEEFQAKHSEQTSLDASSFWQFKHFFHKHYTAAEKAQGRSSRIAYEKDFRRSREASTTWCGPRDRSMKSILRPTKSRLFPKPTARNRQ